jgi:hypothetical protein
MVALALSQPGTRDVANSATLCRALRTRALRWSAARRRSSDAVNSDIDALSNPDDGEPHLAAEQRSPTALSET